MKLSMYNLSLLSLSLSAHTNDVNAEDNLISAGEVTQFSKQLNLSPLKSKDDFNNVKQSKKFSTVQKSQELAAPQIQALSSAITPVCPTLSTGNLYTL